MPESLTTVDRAKAWLAPDTGILSTQNDPLFERLVPAVSRAAMNIMGRDTLAKTERTETYAGVRSGTLLLRHWPVLSIGSLGIAPGTVALPSSSYTLEAIRPSGGHQRIYLTGGRSFIAPGPSGVSVTYTTGFVATESLVVGEDGKAAVSEPWLRDEGVTAGGAPVSGYSVAEGVYTFAIELAGQAVTISYSYVPADIEQAVIEEVGMLVRSRQHIGEASKVLPQQGGTVSYLPVKISAHTREVLGPYARTVPL